MALELSRRNNPPGVGIPLMSNSELASKLRQDLYVRRLSYGQLSQALGLDADVLRAIIQGGMASELTRTRMTMYYRYREMNPEWHPTKLLKDPETGHDAERKTLIRQINALQREMRREYRGKVFPMPQEDWPLRQLRRVYVLTDFYIRQEFIKRFRTRYPLSRRMFLDSETYWVWKQRLREWEAEGIVNALPKKTPSRTSS